MGNSESILACICLIVSLLSGCATTTPLHDAALNNSIETAKQLINDGADVNAKFHTGTLETPLHYAAKKNSVEIVKLLIEHGADVNATAYNSITPLYNAANIESVEIVKILIEHGADVNVQAGNHTNPLYIAVYNNVYDNNDNRWLVTPGNDKLPKDLEVKSNKFDTARLLIAAGSKITIPNDQVGDNFITAKTFEIAASYFEEKVQKDKAYTLYQSAIMYYDRASSQYPATIISPRIGGMLIDITLYGLASAITYDLFDTSPSSHPQKSNRYPFNIMCKLASQRCENASGKPASMSEETQ